MTKYPTSVDTPLNIISLCSGAGMLDLGVELACPGAKALCYVELDSFAASILLARMEEKALEPAPIWCGNLADCDFTPFIGQVDCITAGFPCQPWSVAGKRKGTDDERWLWDDIVDTIRTVRPRYVFLENVPGLVTGGGLPVILGALAEMGFDAEWGCIKCSDLGASHRRDRFFLLAHSKDPKWGRGITGEQGEEGQRRGRLDGSSAELGDAQESGLKARGSNGVRAQQGHRQGSVACISGEALADAKRDAGGASLAGRQTEGRAAAWGRGQAMANPIGGTPQRRGRPGSVAGEEGTSRIQERKRHQGGDALDHSEQAMAGLPLFAPGPNDPRWPDILELDPSLEPALCGNLARMAGRVDRLRVCGNGVVPLQAAVAFVELSRRLNERM
jgi:DNA (cytosine-5)-methyltransferase 1